MQNKRNVRLNIVASGCDQSVWPIGVVAGCGHWGTLNDDQWSRVFKTSLPCFHSFFSYITTNHQPYIAFNFFGSLLYYTLQFIAKIRAIKWTRKLASLAINKDCKNTL